MEKQPLLNTYVNNLSMAETVDEICRLVDKKKKSYVVAINVEMFPRVLTVPFLNVEFMIFRLDLR